MTLSLCPGGLRWKVLLLLSHGAIVIGHRQASKSVGMSLSSDYSS